MRLEVSWLGTHFAGWQSQARGERTVQDELQRALARLGEAARPVAAGRTDAGVHALCMPLHADVRADWRVPPERLARALNAHLPRDVAVLEAAWAPPGFHARFSCRWRAYRYRVCSAPQRQPLEEGRALWVPGPLDAERMRAAAAHLVGEHDFAAFASREERQTRRRLYALEVHQHGDNLEFFVRGESFLRHMVRALVGTLLEVGQGKLDPQAMPGLLVSGARADAGPNVKPYGLYFVGAGYDPA
nr:tRNA pseudouridine(38-40) synthase TruA [Deinobacterium chartae]